MKTTLVIDDQVMLRLKQEATRRGTTMSHIVESALRNELHGRPQPTDLPPLSTFDSGGELVDIAHREDLYRAMEGR